MAYGAGKVSGVQAVEQVILDGGTRVGLATAGGVLGKGAGLLVFGPAGGVVFGALVPVLCQAQAARVRGVISAWAKLKGYSQWEAEAQDAIEALAEVLVDALEEKLRVLRQKWRGLDGGGLSAYVRVRLADEGRYLHECQARLRALCDDKSLSVDRRALSIIELTAASTVHPYRYQEALSGLNQILLARPGLGQRAEEGVSWVVDKGRDILREGVEAIGKTRGAQTQGRGGDVPEND